MPFWEVRVAASPETTEALTNFLWEQGALGVIEESPAPVTAPGEASGKPSQYERRGERTEPGRAKPEASRADPTPRQSEREATLVRAFYPDHDSSTRLAALVRTYRESLEALGFVVPPGEVQVRGLLDEPWASAWQTSFPPRDIGRRIRVVPPWDAGPTSPEPRITIVIEPGRAFGTGHHGSTESCLLLLEDAVLGAAADTALDLGTGSGILAVAAVKLGVAWVLALDIDPDALTATRINAARNACAERIEAALGGAEGVPAGVRFPLVLSNLLTQAHLGLRSEYQRFVAPGGLIILGGMLENEAGSVGNALAAEGFVEDERVVVEGWAALRLVRERQGG